MIPEKTFQEDFQEKVKKVKKGKISDKKHLTKCPA